MSETSHLGLQVGALVQQAAAAFEPGPEQSQLHEIGRRLDEPLRVAIAGKVKAGKSTLLNALVGERLAPTDASECTTIVTWYRDGTTYRVAMHQPGGVSTQLPFRRDDNALDIDLAGTPASAIEHLEVEWPSATLRDITLIDTPGIDSISTDISARTEGFLTPDSGPAVTDAVLYLMRHLHESDVRFLESFHDQVASQPSAINAVGVLSRADEIGVGRLDAMGSARRIATRYSGDPKVRRLCQIVVPVAGLLAESGATLRQEEFRLIQLMAAADRDVLDGLLVSVDRFVNAEVDLPITQIERQELLDRFGIFGVRLGCALVRQQRAGSSSELADLFVERSGLTALRQTLRSVFAGRSDVLRCRSALLAIERLLAGHKGPQFAAVEAELERILSSVHEFTEVQLLAALRSGAASVPAKDTDNAERLLGASGALGHERLGAPVDADNDTLLQLATEQHRYWQSLSENPLMARTTVDAARVLTRSCEGLIAAAYAARSAS